MIKKFFLTLTSLLLLNSCSMDSILALKEINKVQKVRSTRYTKEYRAYFARETLLPIKNRHKFLFYYNKRTKDLAILLHPKSEYIVYSITNSPKKILHIESSPKKRYRYVNKLLRAYGYKQTNPNSIGYKVSLSRRIFKGHKTYYLRAINYQKLIYQYKKAMRSYNYSKIANIHKKPPSYLIKSYYNTYKKRAKTTKQKREIKRIGYKLGIDKKPEPIRQKKTKTKPKNTPIKKSISGNQLFNKYIACNSYKKLHRFLQTKEAQDKLNFTQFSQLSFRESRLREEELLRNGSIEELIAQYKKTNNPRYKKKAMELMRSNKTTPTL